MSRIFISYKRLDKDKVFRIKDQIESALGEKCWIDLDGIESDAQFMNVIIKAIRECEILLFMYSKTHAQITDFEKDWTVRELNFASKKEKRIVFVNIDGSSLSDEFEFMYGTKQQVDATSDNAMGKLCTDLRTWLNITTLLPSSFELTGPSLSSDKTKSDSLTFRVEDVEFKMIHVEGGTFTMGEGCDAHQVTLSSFYIGETPVTQALWKEVTSKTPSTFEGDQRPVESVSWNDCQDFIKKLNQKTGKKFRMLTEAEWEYAARGGKKSKRYVYAGSNDINEVVWYEENSYQEGSSSTEYGTHPVKQKEPNELGIYDMSGNVWEWCQDWYDGYNKSWQSNPTGASSGFYRVGRGGGWCSDAKRCCMSYRNYFVPDYMCRILGLRLALSE